MFKKNGTWERRNSKEVQMEMIKKNVTWELVSKPWKKAIGVKWIFKTKQNNQKSRLVVKGQA